MNETLVRVLLVAVGLVHLLPGVVACSARRIEQVYGVASDGPDLRIVLQHRGVLLTLVGAGLVAAAALPAVRGAAVVAALVSMLTFMALVLTTRGAGAALRKVMWVDLVATVALAPVALTLSP